MVVVKTVLAHEWLITPAGSDKVAARLASALDVQRVVTAIKDPGVSQALMGTRPVDTLFTDRLPSVGPRRMQYAPVLLAAWAAANVDKSGRSGNAGTTGRTSPADLLVSSTHFGAMGAGRRFEGLHLAYCYSPLRFAWRHDLESERISGPAARVAGMVLPRLREFDQASADTVSLFVAISSSIADRIEAAYGRKSCVVHPCVEVDRFADLAEVREGAEEPSSGYLLCFGRMVPYKRVDLAVRVCTANGLRLVVAGAGPCVPELRRIAGPTVSFEENVSDDRYRALLSGARALVFPGEEDFGIIPVEAMAAGVPVVALGVGGALDTVIDGVTGVLFAEQTDGALATAIERMLGQRFDPAKLHEHARQFRPEAFDERIQAVAVGHLASGERDCW